VGLIIPESGGSGTAKYIAWPREFMVDLVGVRGNSWRSLTGLVGVVCIV